MYDDSSKPPEVAAPVEGESASVRRFRSCRWYAASSGDVSEHCTNRDVLPFAGTTGFRADAWCPDCTHYKARRITKKPQQDYYP